MLKTQKENLRNHERTREISSWLWDLPLSPQPFDEVSRAGCSLRQQSSRSAAAGGRFDRPSTSSRGPL